jgi:hypothetical protein
MRILAKPGKPARIELTTYEKRAMRIARDVCANISHNASGDMKESANAAETSLMQVLQHFAGETNGDTSEQAASSTLSPNAPN